MTSGQMDSTEGRSLTTAHTQETVLQIFSWAYPIPLLTGLEQIEPT